MSSTTNEAQLTRKELEEFRQLHQQAVLDAQQATELAKIAAEETTKAHDQLILAQHDQNDLDRNRIAALELRTAPGAAFVLFLYTSSPDKSVKPNPIRCSHRR